MSVGAALRTHLSSTVADHVYPVLLPQDAAFPAITYQRIDTARLMRTHDERTNKSPSRPRFQINCYATDDAVGGTSGYDSAQTVADAVRASLEGFAGLLGGTQAVTATEVSNQLDDVDTETGRYRSIVDVAFTTTED